MRLWVFLSLVWRPVHGDRALALALDLALALALDLAFALARDRDLDRALALDLALARDRDLDFARDLDLAHFQNIIPYLEASIRLQECLSTAFDMNKKNRQALLDSLLLEPWHKSMLPVQH